MKPSIGRIVHYMSYGSPIEKDGTQRYVPECRAAIITDVWDESDLVSLAVFNPTGMLFNQGLDYSEDKRGGTWHWPEREE
ncbi:hypothetical protein [Rhodococcus qingshengii]|uniref:hypothetical protein n=1 Tax=Rhodococcus qingshengii TaxID=334542 RepID=UPI0035DAB2C5